MRQRIVLALAALFAITALVASPAAPVRAGSSAAYQAITPVRLFDTRQAPSAPANVPTGARSSGSVLTVPVTAIPGVPADVQALSLNVTVTNPTGPGFVSVYGCGARPPVSNLNYVRDQQVANAVLVPVSGVGTICFYVEGGATHLLADVSGYVAAGTTGYAPVASPGRLFDTRQPPAAPLSVPQGRRASGSVLTVPVLGQAGLPSSPLGAVVLNVTAVGSVGPGLVTVYGCGTRPGTSNLNYGTGQTVPNLVIAPVSGDGKVCFYVEGGATYVVADVFGSFDTSGAFTPVIPARAADTRLAPLAALLSPGAGSGGPSALVDDGRPTPYVTGGSGTTIDSYPWQVRVSDGSFLCGGSLIDEEWVLTAAHCVRNTPANTLIVHAGLTYRSSMTYGNGVAVSEVIVHPFFDTGTYVNDIALLHLASPSPAGTPVRLWGDGTGPAFGTPAVVTGWGKVSSVGLTPDQLQVGNVTIQAAPGQRCGSWSTSYYLTGLMACASGGTNVGACNGDSGGPLATLDAGQWRLVGVVSYGTTTCANSPTYPTVFTRVSAYLSWIRQYAPDPGKVDAQHPLAVQVTGSYGVPAGAQAVSLNVTVTEPDGGGYVTVYPCDADPPTASNLNFVRNQTVANAVLARLSAAGTVCIASPVPTHVVVDVNGWFPA